MKKIDVKIERESIRYEIKIGDKISNEFLFEWDSKGAFFVIDDTVADIHKLTAKKLFRFKASEKNKTLQSIEDILRFLKDNGALRDSILIALGGGITGDTAGFAASLYMRGIKFYQVPTTFLAMVDSSVGGKTGVNLGGIKNNVGSFYQPEGVIIDISFLKTLSDIEFMNGFAESLKIAAVLDSEFFFYLKENKDKILKRDENVLSEIIYRSCLLKKLVVEEDEHESNRRKLLNFGHTIAHAIETDSDNKISHGHAVATGMFYETKFALEHGHTDNKTFDIIKDTLTEFGYVTQYKPKDNDKFKSALAKDKKASKSGISIALTGAGLKGKIIDSVNPNSLAMLFN